ncbi:autotransporter domain-containing protein [Mailhella sp.]|uniref:autotransporter domain-containing protein n=1 Tax=Mailhella sp. TaxID=1981029 RepID=UPI004062EF21
MTLNAEISELSGNNYNAGTLNLNGSTTMENLVNEGGTITFGDKASLTVSKSFESDSRLVIDNGASVTLGGDVNVEFTPANGASTSEKSAVFVTDGASLSLGADSKLETAVRYGVIVDGASAAINGKVSGSYAGVRVVNNSGNKDVQSQVTLGAGADISSTGDNGYGVLVYGNSKLVVEEGAKIKAVISGNGSAGYEGTDIVINGGEIIAPNVGIYHPQAGTLTVNAGTIQGENSAIEMRSGTVEISGGKLISTSKEFSKDSNTSGSTVVGAALAISQHGTNLPINATISGGEFQGFYAVYEDDVQGSPLSDQVKIDITGGTFNGKIHSENNVMHITGGTFSHLSALNYLADGADIHASAAEANLAGETGQEEGFFLDGKKASITFDASSVKLTGDLGTKNSGNLTVNADGTVAISGKLDNEGTLNINVGTFELSDGHLCGSGDTGVFNITATEDITLSGGKKPVINTGGKITIAAGGNLTINGTTIDADKLDDGDMDEVGEFIGRTVAIITSKKAQSFTAGNALSIGGDIIAVENATVALKADTGSITGNIETMDTAKVTMDGAFTMDGAIAENSDVTVASGSLTVDAATLGKEGEASDVTTGIRSSLTVAENAALNVDFVNLADKTYTATQYSAAKKALFDGDKGTLNFLNATLVIDEVKEKIVIGAEVETDKDGKTVIQLVNPTVIPHDADHIDDGQEVNYQHHLVIDVVAPDDPHKRQKAPDILVADHDGLQQLSRFDVDKDDHRIEYVFDEHMKNPVFQGGETINDGFAYDQNDKPIKFDMTAKAGMVIEHGDPNEKGNQKGVTGNVVVEEDGGFRVNGTDHKKTEFHYDMIDTAGDSVIAHASIKTKEFASRKGTFVIDPAYFKADFVTSNITGGVGVGIGSVMQFGEVTDLEDMVTKAGLTPEVNPVGIGFLVQGNNAVLAIGQNITLDEYSDSKGALIVNGTKTNAQLQDLLKTTAGTTFASSSLLVVEGDICSGNTAAITDATSSKLTVESGAKLAVAGANANKTYTITSGFAPDSAVAGWDKVVVNKMLTATMSYDNNGIVTVTTGEEVQDSATAFPGIIAKNNLDTMMQNGLADAESADMGVRFLTRAIDTASGYLAEDKIVDTVNEVSRAAVTAGVQNTALRIADAASNTVIGHLSLSQHDGSKSIHADGADFWAAPMYGNLYTSGMVADGASVRGQFGGLALGADLEAGQFLGGKFRLGAAINGGGGQSETKGSATSTQNDYDFGGLNFYAGWNNGALNVIGSVGYGFGNHEVEMSAPVLGKAKADVDTTVFTADLRAEYQLKTEWVDLLPHAGVRYTALRTGAHDLKVGGDVLNSVERDTQNIVQFPVGVTLSKDVAFADWNVKPMVDVSVIPAAGDKKANTKVRFSGIDAVDGVNSRIMDSTSWAGTIGVQAEKGDFTLGLNYGVQASSNETDQNVQLKLGWKF